MQRIQNLATQFHLVESLIPENQELVFAASDMTVSEVLNLMQRVDCSQVPVLAGGRVLGIFSYRTLVSRLVELDLSAIAAGKLPVVEFVQQSKFVQPTDSWESILDYLFLDDGALVGRQEDLQGIVTRYDALNYLYRIASPFVMLAEIELSLRHIIQSVTSDEELQACIAQSLKQFYDSENLPTSLEAMTFNDYIQILGDGRNWSNFAPVFGEMDWQRKQLRKYLEEVRDLRNDVFHFRRELNTEDTNTLTRHRNWLQLRVTAFDGLVRKEARSSKDAKGEVEIATVWDQYALIAHLRNSGQAQTITVVDSILEWAESNNLEILWQPTPKGFVVNLFKNKDIRCTLLTVSAGKRNPSVQIHFEEIGTWPVFSSTHSRMGLINQINRIPGISVPEDAFNSRPAIFLAHLRNETSWNTFQGVLDEIVERLM